MKTLAGSNACALPRNSRRGWVAIMVAIVGLLLIALVGVAVDTAYTWSTAHQLQKAADAAALAAARIIKTETNLNQYSSTRAAAVAIAAANAAAGVPVAVDPNPGNTPGGDVVVGTWDTTTQTFTPDVGSPGQPPIDTVRVVARRTPGAHGSISLLFGQIFGTSTTNVTRSAIARLAPPADPLILVLHPTKANAMRMDGTSASMDVLAGTVHVDSTNDCAIQLNGTPTLVAKKVTTCGDMCGTITSPFFKHEPYQPDPLAGLPYPTGLALPLGPSGQITGPGTYQPGRYPKGINMNGGVAILQPGIYSIGGQGGSVGIDLKGDSIIQGNGVMLFIEQGARVDIGGSGAGAVLTPQLSGTYMGVTIFSHRQNSSNKAVSIGGGGIFDVAGTIYVAGGTLDMSGTPGKKIGRMVVNELAVSGTCGFTMTGINVPPPTGPDYVFLVQ
jgi:Flp pilus assembly protein TadG